MQEKPVVFISMPCGKTLKPDLMEKHDHKADLTNSIALDIRALVQHSPICTILSYRECHEHAQQLTIVVIVLGQKQTNINAIFCLLMYTQEASR